MTTLATYPKCINHPKRTGSRRGLCASCYQSISKKIKDGIVNEAVAIKSGLILAKRKAGRIRSIKPFPLTR